MTPRTYASPEAFKQALEQRLRSSAKTGAELPRKRQLLVFDRFLARVVAVLGDAATLKGGLVLELRLERARTTRDVDLRLLGAPDDVLAKLQDAGRQNLGDFMTFEVGPDDEHPEIKNDGMQYDGLCFRAECKLAGELYGQPFGVDIAFGDPNLGEPEVVVAEDVLAFAGIAPPTLRLCPIETHIAKKLHSYTMPRARPNSRVKDLPDLALLATAQPLDAKRLVCSLARTPIRCSTDRTQNGILLKIRSDTRPPWHHLGGGAALGHEGATAPGPSLEAVRITTGAPAWPSASRQSGRARPPAIEPSRTTCGLPYSQVGGSPSQLSASNSTRGPSTGSPYASGASPRA